MNRFEMKLGSFSIAILLLCTFAISRAEQFSVKSPNQLLTMSLEVGENLTYSVSYNGEEIIKSSSIALHLASGTILGDEPVVQTTDVVNLDETLYPVLGKNNELAASYQELTIVFEGNYALILRAYDEGVAYRFKTSFDHEIFIELEEANFVFGEPVGSVFPTADPTMRSWERAYDTYSSLDQINQDQFCITPALFRNEQVNIVIAESDLFSYPGLYLQPAGENTVQGKWAYYPKTVSDPDDVYAYHRVLERENYLAKTEGTRTFPWRVIIVNEDDKDLLNNELIYKLATASKLGESARYKE
jgi:alpha-glucosidase